jgi:WD40 repeat protein
MRKLWIVCLLLIVFARSPRTSAQDNSPTFQLTHQLGRGHIQSIEWHPTNDMLLVSTIRGAWFYDSLLRDLGHIEAARLATFSLDGALVAGVDAENQITLWNSETYASVGALSGHEALVTAIAWSRSGEFLASADRLGNLFVWDTEQQDAVSGWSVAGIPTVMRWSPDGTLLAMVMQDTALTVYDVKQKHQVFYAEPARCCNSFDSSSDVVWLDNQMLLRGVLNISEGQQYEQWNIETGGLVPERSPQVNMNLSPQMAYSPDGSKRALSSTEHVVIIDSATGDTLHEFDDIPWFLDRLVWSNDGTKLVGVGAFGRIYVWDTATTERLAISLEHDLPTPMNALFQFQLGDPNVMRLPSWSFDGQFLAVPDRYSALSIWDSMTWDQVALLEGHDAPVIKAAWNPENNKLVTLQQCVFWGDSYTVHIWDGLTGKLIDSYAHDDCPSSAAWHPTGNILSSVSGTGAEIFVWDSEQRQLGHPLEIALPDAAIPRLEGISWSPDGKHFVLSRPGGDGNVTEMFDYPALTRTPCIEPCYIHQSGHSYFTYRTYWSADSAQWFNVSWYNDYARAFVDAVEGDPFRVEISVPFSTQTNELQAITLHGHSAPIIDIAPDPSGTNLITLSQDNEARLWDVFTGQALLVLPDVSRVAWSPDGTLIGGFNVVDQVWHIYDAQNGDVIASLPVASQEAGYLVWSPDSQKIAQVVDGVVFIWERLPHAVESLRDDSRAAAR